MKSQIIPIALIIIFFNSFACKSPIEAKNPQLQKIASYALSIPEPSGLALGKNGEILWTVSDQTGQIYQLDLNGNVLQNWDINGDDLEGAAFDEARNCLWIVEEEKRQLLKINLSGQVAARYSINFPGEVNSGFEGVCVDKQGSIFVLNEKNPAALLELAGDQSIAKIFHPGVVFDFSDVASDTTSGRFWILGDEKQLLFLWDKNQGALAKFSVPVKNPEGLAIDFDRERIYIVSDSEQMLYIFKLDK